MVRELENNVKREFNTHLSNLLQQWFDAHGKGDSTECQRIKGLALDEILRQLGGMPESRNPRDRAESVFQNMIIWFTK